MNPRLSLSLSAMAVVLGTVRAAHAQQQPAAQGEMLTVTTVAGDTCTSIAQRVYGSATRIDVIHTYNTLGAMPHRFNAGQTLRLPRVPPPPRPVADAEVGFVRNDVRAYTPGEHNARLREPVNRGQRVGTLANSSADVVMGNERAVHLEEHTLVVVLGRYSFQTQQRETAQDTRLERGTLLASLGTLSGRPPPQPIVVATPSASVAVSPGEVAVNVDQNRATQVSVHTGSAQVSARGATVTVTEGNGTTVARGQRPTPPHPLPPRPKFTKGLGGLIFKNDEGAVVLTAEYGVESRASSVTKWRVQFARDARFRDLISDEKVNADVTKFEVRNVNDGDYYLRVRSIDSARFESPASEVQHVIVSTPRLLRGEPGRRAAIEVSDKLFCGVDGGALAPVAGPLVLSPLRPHEIRCALDAEGKQASSYTVKAEDAAPVLLQTRVGEPQWQGSDGARLIVARLTDALGAPIADTPITATLEGDATLDAPVATREPGTFAARVRWSGRSADGVKVHFALNGNELAVADVPVATVPVGAQRTTNTTTLAYAPFVPHWDGGLGIGLLASLTPLGVGFSTQVGARYRAHTPVLELWAGLSLGYSRFDCLGGPTSGPNTYCTMPPMMPLPGMPVTNRGLMSDVFSIGVPLGLAKRFGEHFVPFVIAEPQLLLGRVSEVKDDAQSTFIETYGPLQPSFGIRATLGLQLEFGRHAPYIEAGYQYAAVSNPMMGTVSPGGIAASAGYRVMW